MAACAYRSRLVRLVIVLSALAALLAGCDLPWQAKPSDMAKDQTLKMVWSIGIDQPDPAFSADPGLIQLDNLLYDGLVTIDRNGHLEPWGAASWTVSPDGLTYTFTLRPHQRFSDGTPVIASDYAWSIDRAAHACHGSRVFYELAAIEGAAQLNESDCGDPSSQPMLATLVGRSILPDDSANTLTIQLAQPAGYFLATLATSASMALERRVVDERIQYDSSNYGADAAFVASLSTGVTGQGGSGMFYLAKSAVSAVNNPGSLTLKPNPYWWGIAAGKKPNLSEIAISTSSSDATYSLFYGDPTVAFSSVLAENQPPAHFAGQPYYHAQPATAVRALLFSWSTPPFDDLNARKAFCLAINRDQFNQQVYQGAMLPNWHLVPQGMDSYNPSLKGLDGAPVMGNVTLAKHYWQLYLAAHHQQAPLITIDFGSLGSPSYLESSVWLRTAWQQTLGVTTVIDRNEWGMGPGWEHSRQIAQFSSGDDEYVDPQTIFSDFTWYVTNVPLAPAVDVPAAATLLQQADELMDMRQRTPLYQQAEQVLIDNVSLCPLFQVVNHYALRTWVKGGFVEDGRGIVPNDAWVTGYIAKH
ncbi:MAG TPA: ABC transporter substrate-binding protein [Ktedonobacterales bacterium]